ncbi:transcription factor bHLH18-like [Lolium rigidum]|uniref:transcription factor bHLH18-like n=1 Tax=Lolium rigidum TaxID=89674 RepID=UPI001F5D800D|nr:transcription factor bHLH18-like [Lolium rigidum]
MEDSTMFIQWAMETLQHEHHPAAAAAYADAGEVFPSLQVLRCSELQNGTAPAAAQAGNHHRATDSWSSGDSGRENTPGAAVVENDGWSSNCSVGSTTYPPVSWNFTSTMAQPSIHDEATPTARARPLDVPEPAYRSPASRKRSAKSAACTGTGHTSSPEPFVQEHVMAERKRREKINRQFIELSTVIPGLKKMDKATILSDAVRYVKEQQEKLKELEDRNLRTVEPVVLVKRPCIATKPDGTATTGSSLPEIEARISNSTVMVKIHCEDGKGLLARLLTEVEGLRLRITHTNAIPFPACTVNITIMAKMDEGFNITADDILGKLDASLH